MKATEFSDMTGQYVPKATEFSDMTGQYVPKATEFSDRWQDRTSLKKQNLATDDRTVRP